MFQSRLLIKLSAVFTNRYVRKDNSINELNTTRSLMCQMYCITTWLEYKLSMRSRFLLDVKICNYTIVFIAERLLAKEKLVDYMDLWSLIF